MILLSLQDGRVHKGELKSWVLGINDLVILMELFEHP